MSTEPLRLEYLHKEELRYEFEARGVPVSGFIVADHRSGSRTFRDTELNVQLFKNIDIFLEPSKHVTLCSDKLVVLKDLIRNTDTAGIAADFPLYVHRLRHGMRALFTLCSMLILILRLSWRWRP
jgi:hypothetical protein